MVGVPELGADNSRPERGAAGATGSRTPTAEVVGSGAGSGFLWPCGTSPTVPPPGTAIFRRVPTGGHRAPGGHIADRTPGMPRTILPSARPGKGDAGRSDRARRTPTAARGSDRAAEGAGGSPRPPPRPRNDGAAAFTSPPGPASGSPSTSPQLLLTRELLARPAERSRQPMRAPVRDFLRRGRRSAPAAGFAQEAAVPKRAPRQAK